MLWLREGLDLLVFVLERAEDRLELVLGLRDGTVDLRVFVRDDFRLPLDLPAIPYTQATRMDHTFVLREHWPDTTNLEVWN